MKKHYGYKIAALGIASAMTTAPIYSTIVPVYATESLETTESLEAQPLETEMETEEEIAKPLETDAEGNIVETSDAPTSFADLINEQKNVLSDLVVYQIRIGYEFDDGSFDEWARGTGFLVAEKFILTSQTLTDTTTKSNLFSKIQDERSDMYSKVGISLSNQEMTESHLKIYVTDSKGNKIAINNATYKNGMGLITLKNAAGVSCGIFSDELISDLQEGQEVNLKFAGMDDDLCDVQTEKGEFYIPDNAESTSSAFYFKADTTIGNPLGAPVYDANGNILGMVANISSGESLMALNADVLKTFLASNGVTYKTDAQVKEEQKAEDDAQAKKDAEAAGADIAKTESLEKALKAAGIIDLDEYTKSSAAALEEAVEDGKRIMENATKTQAQIDTATENINTAIDNLQKAGFLNQIKEFVLGNIKIVIYGIGGVVGVIIVGSILSKELKKTKKKKGKNEKNAESQTGNDESEELRKMEMNDLAEAYARDDGEYDDYEEFDDLQERMSTNVSREKHEAAPSKRKNTRSEKHDFAEVEEKKAPAKKVISTFGDGFDDDEFVEEDDDIDITTRVQPKSAAIPTGKRVPGLTYGGEEYEDAEDLSDDGSDDTTVLKRVNAYLIRVETGRKIPISKDNFLIGKERKKVDYCISNNGSISRIHARIFKKGDTYCIEDQMSTNYTYVNNQQIPSYTAICLQDGTPIRLSDVEFEFHEGK